MTKWAAFQLFHVGAIWVDPGALLWQVLAAIAIGGIVIVLIFAIIEPGPLVRKRPFPRRKRTAPADAESDEAKVPGEKE